MSAALRYPLTALLAALPVALFVWLFAPLIQILEYKSVDFRFYLRDRAERNLPVSDAVYHLSVDDYTHKASGNYFWGRQEYARILNRLRPLESETVALDVIFAGSRSARENLALIDAVSRMDRLVMAYHLQPAPNPQLAPQSDAIETLLGISGLPVTDAVSIEPQYPGILPMEMLWYHIHALGFVNRVTDSDGVIRRYPLIRRYGDRLLPSFALSTFAQYAHYDLGKMAWRDGTLHLPDLTLPGRDTPFHLAIPLDPQGNLIINFSGKFDSGAFTRVYSAYDFLHVKDDAMLKSLLHGRIGIVSDLSSVGKDWCTTPLEQGFPYPFLYASILSSLLQDAFIRETSAPTAWLLILLLPVLIARLGARLTLRHFTAAGSAALLLYLTAAVALFVYADYLIPMIAVSLSLIVALGAVTVLRYLDEFRYHSRVEAGLRSYVSPALLQKLKSDPDFLRPGGERKYITALFADIAGFTAFCDRSDPDVVQSALQDYYAIIVNAVFANGGIIDKFLGDGVLAFFEHDANANGARQAVATAITMQQQIRHDAHHWESRYGLHLGIRIGIATGYATVGNLGLKEKLDYTIIGRKVNLASRLESFGTAGDITIDKETFEALDGGAETELIGPIKVKGFAEAVTAYKVTY